MKTIDEVQTFLEEFVEKEYGLHIARKKITSSRDEHIDNVYDLFDEAVLFSAESFFNSLTAWSDDNSLEERERFINNILRKRKLFAIEHYKGVKLDSAIKNAGVSDDVFVCYVSDISEVANHRYFNKFFIAEADNNLKIIATEQHTPEGWKEIRQFQSIENLGELVQTKKIQAPSKEENLWHYDSL